jgi:hypothetical protein
VSTVVAIVVARIPAREHSGITDGAAAAVSTLHPGACIMLAYLLACQLVAYATRRGFDAVILCDVAHVAIPSDAGLSWVPVRRVTDLHALVGAA